MNVFTTEYTECTEFHRVLILLLDSICHSERSEESTLSCQYSLMSILIPVYKGGETMRVKVRSV